MTKALDKMFEDVIVEKNLIERPALVLNKQWRAISSRPVWKVLSNVYDDKAHILGPDYQLFNMDEWIDLGPEDGKPSIKTLRGEIRVPEVVVNRCDKMPEQRCKFSRRNIWKRDCFRCQYCGKRPPDDEITIDHVIPQEMWDDEWHMKGEKMPFKKTSFENCVLACIQCNKAKANRTLKESGMHLFRMSFKDGQLIKRPYSSPKAPQWSPVYAIRRKKFPQSWKEWISGMVDELYWEVELEQ